MKSQNTIDYSIHLNKNDANWLMCYMQNGLPDESNEDARMREDIFNSLRDQGVGDCGSPVGQEGNLPNYDDIPF